MKLDLVIDLMLNVPSVTFTLILFMALSAALLVNHILQLGTYATLFCVPALVLSGLLGQAVFLAHGIAITPDKASNIAIAASAGFMFLAVAALTAYRIYTRLNDHA